MWHSKTTSRFNINRINKNHSPPIIEYKKAASNITETNLNLNLNINNIIIDNIIL